MQVQSLLSTVLEAFGSSSYLGISMLPTWSNKAAHGLKFLIDLEFARKKNGRVFV